MIYEKDYNNFGTVVFNTKEAAAVWCGEILGQISDGKWENAKPLNHWKFWTNANIDVKNNMNPGWSIPKEKLDRPKKSFYDVTKLNSAVKIRIEDIIRFAKSRWCTAESIENRTFVPIMKNIMNSEKMNDERINEIFGNETVEDLMEKDGDIKESWFYKNFEESENHTPEELKAKEIELTEYNRKKYEFNVSFRDWIKSAMAELGIHNHQDLVNAKNEVDKIYVDRYDRTKVENEIMYMFSHDPSLIEG